MVERSETMFNYYIYKSYFNAKHSFDGSAEGVHGHSFTVVTYIGLPPGGEQIPFYRIEAVVSSFVDRYRGRYLNDLPEFAGRENTLETIGDVFYEELKELLLRSELELYELDISENPLCVYQVSDRLLLPTLSMEASGRNFERISEDRLKLEAMTKAI